MLKAKHELAIVLFAQNEETGKYDVSYPFVTKSFGEFIGMKNSVYIDLNNCPFAVDLLKQGFAEDILPFILTSIYGTAGVIITF